MKLLNEIRDSKIGSTKQLSGYNLKLRSITYLVLGYILILGYSCTENESHYSVLGKTKEKINNHKLMTYNYESFWDNKYNDSEFRDTSFIELEKSDNIHGLVFYISDSSHVDFFDGVSHKEMNHAEARIINYDPEDIVSDSSYFMYRMNLMAQPTHFLNIDSTYLSKDSIIEGRGVVIFTNVKENDYEGEIIKSVSSYVIDKSTYEPWIFKTTSIKNKDTSQVLTHYFKNIEFSNQSIDFEKVRSFVLELGYSEIASNQLEDEMSGKQIQIGSKIPIEKFENIFEEETSLFGKNGKKTVLMFSFIGCGGCEYAMKEMKKKNFAFNEDIDFYYSSPIDKSDIVKEYLAKKEFKGIGFGKESKMNESFNTYRYPTFFIIDSIGTISDIYHGYRNGFEEEIF